MLNVLQTKHLLTCHYHRCELTPWKLQFPDSSGIFNVHPLSASCIFSLSLSLDFFYLTLMNMQNMSSSKLCSMDRLQNLFSLFVRSRDQTQMFRLDSKLLYQLRYHVPSSIYSHNIQSFKFSYFPTMSITLCSFMVGLRWFFQLAYTFLLIIKCFN